MTALTQGMIPAHTACPYADKCPIKSAGECGHKGVEHSVEYSCGAARLYDSEARLQAKVEARHSQQAKDQS